MTPRLVACDLDGTLIARDNRLSDRVSAAVEGALAAGIFVVAVTGRPWQWTLDIARRHHLLPAAVCSNGAVLVDVVTGAVEMTGLADGLVAGLVDRVRDVAPDVRFAVDGVDSLVQEKGFLDEPFPGAPDIEVPDLTPHLQRDVVKIISRVPGMRADTLAALLDHEVLGGVAVPAHGAGEWVELLPAGVSKASGLAVLCERLGVDHHEVVAVGDGWNDLPMLEWAGTAVVMADAPDEVLAVADRVVPSSQDDGVAVLLESFFVG